MGFDQLNPPLNLDSSWICEAKATPSGTDVVLYLANPSIIALQHNVVEQHAQPIVE
jgi:hypothetical protein